MMFGKYYSAAVVLLILVHAQGCSPSPKTPDYQKFALERILKNGETVLRLRREGPIVSSTVIGDRDTQLQTSTIAFIKKIVNDEKLGLATQGPNASGENKWIFYLSCVQKFQLDTKEETKSMTLQGKKGQFPVVFEPGHYGFEIDYSKFASDGAAVTFIQDTQW
jgi:hypothetical protein